MRLRYILGNSGSGKTEICLNEIITKQNNDSNNLIIYIVPEQFSLQSEKDLISKIETQTLIKTQVLSFKRLAYHLFSETGKINDKILEDSGKTMLIRKIIFELKDSLVYFNKSVNKQGFLENISNTISEFFQYNITPDILKNSLENFKEKENLYLKLNDLYLIFKKYMEFIKNKYISTDETLDYLAEKIRESSTLLNSEIWIDGFNSFTPQEFKVIENLMHKAKQINVTFCINNPSIEYNSVNFYDPFYTIKNTINKFTEIARKNNIVIESPLYLNTNKRFINNAEMQFLEKNFMKSYSKQYSSINKNIEIFEASNKYCEIVNTASKIISLVRDKNYRFNDIAVIIGSSDYGKPLKNIFNQFDIPCFIDIKKDIKSHPFTEFICSLIDIVVSNWSYESVFRLLKTNLIQMDDDDINLLENYILAYGIKGGKWKNEHWTYGFDGNSEFNEDDINYLKDCVKETIEPFTSAFKNNSKYTVAYISSKLFDLITSIDIPLTLNTWIDEAKKENKNESVLEHQQIWGIITEIFEKLVEILGDEKITVDEYSKIINAGFSNCTMGLIPPSQDQIIIGDIQRTRLPNIKALFILGVNDGNIPMYKEDTEILSDSEKEAMFNTGLEVSPDSKRKISSDQFLIYSSFTKPSNFLYISYSVGDLDGNPKRASIIIDKILKMFPNLKVITDYNNNLSNSISMPIPTFENITKLISSYSDIDDMPLLYKDVYNWFKCNSEFSKRIEMIKNGITQNIPNDYLKPRTAKKLYGKNIYSSVTKLEKFTKCPFSFFIQYGLKVRDRKLYQLNPPDIGNLFHNVIEDFSVTLKENNLNWRNLDKNELNKMVDISIDRVVPKLSSEILLSNSRYKYIIQRVKRITKRSVWALSEHIKQGLFEPLEYEIGFGDDEKLPPIVIELYDESKIILTGKIDRIDILDSENKKYVKIIDYKSYDKKYDLMDIYYGMQLQLILYLDEFLEKGSNILNNTLLPGGMFYFKIDDPLINIDTYLSNDEIEYNILKTFNISGLILNETNVITALDKEADIDKDKISISKIRGIKSSSEITDLEHFNNLRNYVKLIVSDIGNEMIHGNIKIEPFKKKNKTGCDYCMYKSICGFEIIDKENKYRILKPLKSPWENISTRLSQKENN